jgi:hypothetical protein
MKGPVSWDWFKPYNPKSLILLRVSVSVEGVWIGNWIYCTLRTCNYRKLKRCTHPYNPHCFSQISLSLPDYCLLTRAIQQTFTTHELQSISAVSRLYRYDPRHPSGIQDQNFITVWQLRVCRCGVPYLTIGRACRLQLVVALCQRFHFRVQVPWNSLPYFTISDLRFL